MVDATTGHKALFFMEGPFGYNQICMAPKAKEHTAFKTPKGIYCYKVMPFGLKNLVLRFKEQCKRSSMICFTKMLSAM